MQVAIFEKLKDRVNRAEIGKSISVEHITKEEEDILYMMRLAGIILIKEGVTVVALHMPEWFDLWHLDFLAAGDREETNRGMTMDDIFNQLQEFTFNSGCVSSQNVNFTVLGSYRYTYKNTQK